MSRVKKLAKEMTGEAALDRAQHGGPGDCPLAVGPDAPAGAERPGDVREPLSTEPKGELYAKLLEEKYSNINRCC